MASEEDLARYLRECEAAGLTPGEEKRVRPPMSALKAFKLECEALSTA